MKHTYEIIFIDDGSSDDTFKQIMQVKKKDSHVVALRFRRNFGQSSAWEAGFTEASGDVIVVMDSDLQNDPKDIPRMLDALTDKYDAVSGWRKARHDSFSKKFFSSLANPLRRWLTGEKIHDSGCSLKVYRADCVKDIRLFGEMHRYITALLTWKGYRVGEIKVNHRARKHGKTKYSMSRLFKGFMDLILVWFWQKYSNRPIHVFGFLGLSVGLLGFVSGLVSIYLKIFRDVDLSNTFLPTVSIFFVLIGLNLIVSGIIADICVKNYYKDKTLYTYRRY
tara:strand:- start:39 stop:875 length:837 start_codon:yes stop_codon:yes gene_type:complete